MQRQHTPARGESPAKSRPDGFTPVGPQRRRCLGGGRDPLPTVFVRDSGWGIPEEHREKIFERFYRVDEGRARNGGGAGLGLSLVREIARLHGGDVVVESAEGKGSCFTLTLPDAG